MVLKYLPIYYISNPYTFWGGITTSTHHNFQTSRVLYSSQGYVRCQCLNIGSGDGRNIPTDSRDSHCSLFIVLQKAGRIGNWFLFRTKGKSVSQGIINIGGIQVRLPRCSIPVAISASIKRFRNALTERREPLHIPCVRSRLRRKIIEANSLSKRCGGKSVGAMNWEIRSGIKQPDWAQLNPHSTIHVLLRGIGSFQ